MDNDAQSPVPPPSRKPNGPGSDLPISSFVQYLIGVLIAAALISAVILHRWIFGSG
jgi:hypothetical protein